MLDGLNFLNMTDVLLLRDNAKQQLAEIKSIETGINYLNKVKAIEVWAKAEKKDAELQNMIAEQKIRTQRILGKLLKESEVSKAGYAPMKKVESQDSIPPKTKLSDFGISANESSTFQKIAALPEEIFEREISVAKDESKKRIELTTSRLLTAAKKYEFETNKTEFDKIIETTNENQIIINGNSIDILPTLEKNKYDLLLTDPPYGMDFKSGWNDKNKIANDNINNTISVLNDVLLKSIPLLKDDAHFYIFGNIDYLEQIKPIIENYLVLKNILIWDRKVIGMGDLKSYGKSYDIIYFGYKKIFKELNGVRDRDILEFNRVDPLKNIHPTEKPLDLLQYLIKKSTKEKDCILDPFAGGGSTLLAAKSLNRMATGIELENNYYKLIKSRL
jgi:site-specific DNA-methyltransferase (adenine-specific)